MCRHLWSLWPYGSPDGHPYNSTYGHSDFHANGHTSSVWVWGWDVREWPQLGGGAGWEVL